MEIILTCFGCGGDWEQEEISETDQCKCCNIIDVLEEIANG